jgi:tetratricopeptide (TPR) repeat protein
MSRKKRKAPEELLAEARRKGGRGDFEGAAESLEQLLPLYPDDEDLRFLYAALLFELDRYAEALPHFESVIEIQPLNEWASLGVVHCRWKAGLIREAMSELKRFHRAGGESMEHRRLVKEIIQSGLSSKGEGGMD